MIYIVKCPTCKEEYIGEIGIRESRLRDDFISLFQKRLFHIES